MAAYSGFAESEYDNVFIILDKMDKIGLDGVKRELEECGYAAESVEKYLQIFEEITSDVGERPLVQKRNWRDFFRRMQPSLWRRSSPA